MTIQHGIQLSDILWYKIGGKTKYYIEATSEGDILDAVEFIKENNIQNVFVCGLGANLVFTDGYYDGCVIRISTNENTPNSIRMSESGFTKAFAGELLDSAIIFAFNNNLTGLEWAGGLPGTVGAAVRGNVGAYGGEIKDTLHSAKVLVLHENGTHEIKTFLNHELKFAYRHSVIKEHRGKMIVITATFQLKEGSEEELVQAKNEYALHIQQRKDRHPLEYPNTGSVFKNIREPEKIAAVLRMFPDLEENINTKWYGKVASASLIQRLGLQGFRIGDAQVSTKHALFIVNLGHATAKDVRGVIDTIQNKFHETFGFTLEPEVEIVQG